MPLLISLILFLQSNSFNFCATIYPILKFEKGLSKCLKLTPIVLNLLVFSKITVERVLTVVSLVHRTGSLTLGASIFSVLSNIFL